MSIFSKLLPAPLQVYVPLIKAGLVLAILGGTWLHGHYTGVKSQKAAHQVEISEAKSARIKEYEDQLVGLKVAAAKLEADSTQLQTQLDEQKGLNQILQDTLARVPLVVHEPNPIPGGAPIVRLSPAVRVCLNAATLGTAEAAADCKAIGVRAPAAP